MAQLQWIKTKNIFMLLVYFQGQKFFQRYLIKSRKVLE